MTEKTANDDIGTSKQPALRPVFQRVAPKLVKPFQAAFRGVNASARRKIMQTYYKSVKLNGDPGTPKNKKLIRDILVLALRKDLGWLEFVAEQILDGSEKELLDVLAPATTASMKTGSAEPEYYTGNMFTVDEGTYYPEDDYDTDRVCELENCIQDDIEVQSGIWARYDGSAWVGPFGNVGEAKSYIADTYNVDPESGEEKPMTATMKIADVIDSIYEGRYPTDFSNVQFPVAFKIMGQSDEWSRLCAVARDLNLCAGRSITVSDAAEATELFDALMIESASAESKANDALMEGYEGSQKDDAAIDAYVSENYNEYMSDVHEPAIILARELGL